MTFYAFYISLLVFAFFAWRLQKRLQHLAKLDGLRVLRVRRTFNVR